MKKLPLILIEAFDDCLLVQRPLGAFLPEETMALLSRFLLQEEGLTPEWLTSSRFSGEITQICLSDPTGGSLPDDMMYRLGDFLNSLKKGQQKSQEPPQDPNEQENRHPRQPALWTPPSKEQKPTFLVFWTTKQCKLSDSAVCVEVQAPHKVRAWRRLKKRLPYAHLVSIVQVSRP